MLDRDHEATAARNWILNKTRMTQPVEVRSFWAAFDTATRAGSVEGLYRLSIHTDDGCRAVYAYDAAERMGRSLGHGPGALARICRRAHGTEGN